MSEEELDKKKLEELIKRPIEELRELYNKAEVKGDSPNAKLFAYAMKIRSSRLRAVGIHEDNIEEDKLDG